VVIGRALFEELLRLSPDEGTNTVIRKYRDATTLVEVGDKGILIDVDNPDVYRRWCEA
jgi:CTP:molybdopterin cytidylyltransferase MocA